MTQMRRYALSAKGQWSRWTELSLPNMTTFFASILISPYTAASVTNEWKYRQDGIQDTDGRLRR
jgi:hypothetical protein